MRRQYRNNRILHRRLGLAAMIVLAGQSVQAQSTQSAQNTQNVQNVRKVTFEPSLWFRATYSDNVLYLGTEDDVDDSSAGLYVALPVTRQFKKGQMDLEYGGGYTKYTSFEVLDNWEHRFRFRVQTALDRRSNLLFDAMFTQTQVQGNPAAREDQDYDFFLTQRSTRAFWGGGLTYERQIAAKWQWFIGARTSRARYEQIVDDSPVGLSTVEDRDSYMGTTGLTRTLSRKFSLGGIYRYRKTLLESNGTDDTHSLGLTISHRISEFTTLDYEIGAFHRIRNAEGSGQDIENTQIYASLGIEHDKPLGKVQLGFLLATRPTSGGSLPGTSTNTTAAITLSPTRARHWYWQVISRYTRRDSSESNVATISTASLGAFVQRSMTRAAWFRVGLTTVEQMSDGGAVPGLEGRFTYADLGIVWYPGGRT